LYTYGGNFRALKALIAAGYSGANVTVDPNFVFGKTNKAEPFLKKFPLGKVILKDNKNLKPFSLPYKDETSVLLKVPTFESKDGKVLLSESDAIAYYVANETLKGGKVDMQQALVLQWLSFAQTELHPAICGWLFPSMSIMPFNKDVSISTNCLILLRFFKSNSR